jgi:ABC-type lipoprotein export system ATPase subunit
MAIGFASGSSTWREHLQNKKKQTCPLKDQKKNSRNNNSHSICTSFSLLVTLILYTLEDLVIQDDKVVAMGGMESLDIAFDGIKLALKTKKNGKDPKENSGERLILDGSICGRARPGRLLAIMGPSGAGKSTVLHALAGRIKESNQLSTLQGHRFLNFQPVAGSSMLPVAFIEQDVNFFPHMTVQETLDFRVQLKLGSLLSPRARNEMVHDLMNQVGLLASADTIVGNANVRGLSGGERKRLSIAVEMISSPAAIFLDEPTSGTIKFVFQK